MKSIADLNTFVCVVNSGTLSGAGVRLGLSPASISKRISRLESEIGVRLLNRSSRAMALTEEGRLLYQKLQAILEELEEATALVSRSSRSAKGKLKVAATVGLGRNRIAPLVAEFAQLYSDVSVQLYLGDAAVDFVRENYDVAIVIGQPMDSTLVAKCLMNNHCVVCAAPSYLKGRPPVTKPSDLKEHECLVLDCYNSYRDLWPLASDRYSNAVRVSGSLVTNNSETLREWALAGFGIALKSVWDIKDELNRGDLVQLLPDYRVPNLDFYIVYGGRKNLPARTRSFIEFIEKRINEMPV